MKKTLLTATLIAALSGVALTAEAFTWSNLNPFAWGQSSRCCGAASPCTCQKDKCKKKTQSCCPTKNPCQKEAPKCNTCQPQTSTCNPCDRLQQETAR